MKLKKYIIIIFLILGSCFLFFSLPLVTVFSFTETKTNNPQVFYINVQKDKNFKIRFTHSIHLTDVLESYQVTKSNKIKLVSMEYEDVAVGMPAYAEEGQKLKYENGKYLLSYDDEKIIDNFTLYVGNIDMDLYFIYRNETYNLKKELKKGRSYLFEVKKISFYQLMKGAVKRNENR